MLMNSASGQLTSTIVHFTAIVSLIFSQFVPSLNYLANYPKQSEPSSNSAQNPIHLMAPVLEDSFVEHTIFLPLIANQLDLFTTPGPDLAIAKAANKTTVLPGETISYTLTYENLGPFDATGVTITEFLPANSIIHTNSLVAGWQQVGTSNQYTYIIGSLPTSVNGSVNFRITVLDPLPDNVLAIENTVTIRDDGTNGIDPNLANNNDHIANSVDFQQNAPDLAINLTAGSNNSEPGESLHYDIDYSNLGSAISSNVIISALFPDIATFNIFASSSGWQASGTPGKFNYSVGNLDSGEEGNLEFSIDIQNAIPSGIDQLEVTVWIEDDGENGIDPNPGNNSSSHTIGLNAEPDLSLSVAPTTEAIDAGDIISFTIDYFNTGNQDAIGVNISITLPDYADIELASSTSGWYASSLPGKYLLDIGNLTVGTNGTAVFAAKVDQTLSAGIDDLPITHALFDDGTNGADPNPGNNSITTTTIIHAAPDLMIIKSDGGISGASPGGNIIYTLTSSNHGDQDATGCYLLENLPANTTYDSANSTPGWEQIGISNQYRYNFGGLSASDSLVVDFALVIDNPIPPNITAIENTATIADDNSNGADLNLSDNSDTISTPLVRSPDLTIETRSLDNIRPGDYLEYSLSYANQGFTSATGVMISETVPLYTTFAVAESSSGWQQISDTATYTYSIGSLGIGETGAISFTVKVDTTIPAGVNSITNTATISDDGLNGHDLFTENNTRKFASFVNAQPDLQLTVDAAPASIGVGEILTYTLAYTNTGNQGASGVVMTATLPTNSSFNDSSSSAGWSQTTPGELYRFEIGDLPAGSVGLANFAITTGTTWPAGMETFQGAFSISDDALNGDDPTPSDNQVSRQTTIIAAPDLTITMDDGEIESIPPGGTLIYTLGYSNNGSQDATGVVITETLPVSTTYDSAHSSPGWQQIGSSDLYRFSVGELNTYENDMVSFAVVVASAPSDAVTTITNTAIINDDKVNGLDLNLTDNSAILSTPINLSPDLALQITGNGTTQAGALLRYTLTYANLGFMDTTGVVIQETLPDNTSFSAAVSSPGWQQVGATNAYTFTVDSLDPGAVGSVDFAVTVANPIPNGVTSIYNSASISDDGAHGADPNQTNNTSSLTSLLSSGPTSVCGAITSDITWSADASPYVVTCDVTVNSGALLWVEPGTIVKFNSTSRRIIVNGTLNAPGSQSNPIYFTSYKDDSVGGDTNNDGAASTPAGGNWSTIYVGDTGQANFDNVLIRYGGYSSTYYANLYLTQNAVATVQNSVIASSSYYGIRVNNSTSGKNTRLIVQDSTVENNSQKGIYINTISGATSQVEITSTIIRQNGSNGFETNNVAGLNFQNNLINDNQGYAAYLNLAGGAARNIGGNSGSGNSKNGIALVGPFAQDSTLSPLSDLVYIAPGSGWTVNSGVTLAIQSGQVIKIESSSGNINVDGTLLVAGTSVAPIRFTSIRDDSLGGDTNHDGILTLPVKGNWGGINVRSDGTAVLDHAIIRYGGYVSASPVALVRVAAGGTLTLTNSTLEHSDHYGVYADGVEDLSILNNIISDCDDYGIYFIDANNGTSISPEIRDNVINNTDTPIYLAAGGDGYTGEFRITGNTGSANTHNYIRLEPRLVGSVKLGTSNGLDWVFTNNVMVTTGATWELGPDEVIKLASTSVDIYVDGTLRTTTTAAQPVIFTSLADNGYGYPVGTGTPAKGNWGGIYVRNGGTAVLDHAIIRYGGYLSAVDAYALVRVNAGGTLTLTNSTLEHSDHYGVYADGVEDLSILNNTISDCDDYGIYFIDANNGTPISPEIRDNVINNTDTPIYLAAGGDGYTGEFRITGNTGSANTHNYIRLEPRLVGSVKLGTSNGLDWVFTNNVMVTTGATWELGPDEVIKLASTSVDIYVDGTLRTTTTAIQPVIFTSLADNGYGYPVGTGTPAKGNWGGIYVRNGGTAVLDHAIIRYGGYLSAVDAYALVRVNAGGTLTLTNSTLEHSDHYGVYADGVEDLSILNNTISDCDDYGIYFIDANNGTPISPEIRDNVINNTDTPIYLAAGGDGYTGEFRITGNTGSANTHNYIRLEPRLVGSVKLGTSNGLDWVFTNNVMVTTGATWELGPDEVIKLASTSVDIYVDGTLRTTTTAVQPVIFTSLADNGYGYPVGTGTPAKGNWGGIYVRNGGTAVLDHAIIRYGGYLSAVDAYALVRVNAGGTLTLTNSTLEHSDHYGVYADGVEDLSILNNTISDCDDYGIYFIDANNGTPISPEIRDNVINNTDTPIYLAAGGDGYTGEFRITGNTGSANTHNYIRLEPRLVGSVKLGTSNGLDWVFTNNVMVTTGATWELGPDEVIKLASTSVDIYVDGTLRTTTTAAQPVIFTSLADNGYGYPVGTGTPAKGNWGGIYVRNGGTAVLDHAIIRYGGYLSAVDAYALVRVNAGGTLTLTNSTLEHSDHYGVYADGVEDLSILNNTISDCDDYGIYFIDANNGTPISPEIRDNVINNTDTPIYLAAGGDGYTGEFRITGNTGSANTHNYIRLEPRLVGSVKLGTSNGLDWVFTNNVMVTTGATWELGPDEVIKLASTSVDIYVDGTLRTTTTAIQPVIFTSLADNGYGYPVGTGTPAKGNWGGIYVRNGGTAVLDHAIIRYGGYLSAVDAYALVRVNAGGTLTLTNSTLEHSDHYGVYVQSSTHFISGNSFRAIDSYAVFNGDTANILVHAENNWWGSDSGPSPFGTGYGINYRTCYNSTYHYSYICDLYVDADPWVGKTYYQQSQNGHDIPWQYYDADPVNTATGNYTYNHPDLKIPIKGDLDFVFQRSYNSLDPSIDGVMGYGWQHSYQIRAVEQSDQATITYGNGQVARFTVAASGYNAPVGNFDILTKEPGGTFRLTLRDLSVYAFDILGRISTITDRNGHGLTFNYVGANLSTIVGPAGRVLLVFTYSGGKLSQVTDVIGRAINYAYDVDDNLISITDPKNQTTTLNYDDNHRLASITDANGHTFLTNEYDEDGRVITQWDAEGYSTAFFYNILEHDTTVTDRRGNPTNYDYDELGRLQGVTDPDGNTINYAYDSDFNIIAITDALGFTTSFTYDERGNRLTETDAIGGVTSSTYNDLDLPLTITDANSHTTSFTYDAYGNRLSEQDPLGYTTTYTYYVSTDYRGLLESVSDPRGSITAYTYNNYGDLIQITNERGESSTFNYDGAGRKLNETNPRGYMTTFTYDDLNRTLTVVDALGGVTSFNYNSVGNKISETDPEGQTTTYTFTDRDKLENTIDAGGYITTYQYDDAENLISITDGNGHETTFTYDSLNRRISTTNPENETITSGYDANGNLVTITDGLNHTTTTTYDELNRPIAVEDALGNKTSTDFDAVGNKIQIVDANNHNTTFTYDDRNQLLTVTDAMDGVVTYEYDPAGNRISMIDANNHKTIYTYDELNRLSTITNALLQTQSQTYDANGNIALTTAANGSTIAYTYDLLDRVVNIDYSDGSQVTYSYDTVGNRISMVDGTGTTTYSYDNLYRPISISSTIGTVAYSYDAQNRLTVTTLAGATTYSYDDADRLETVTDWNDQSTNYIYDDAGRLSNTILPNGTHTINTYDNADRLIDITHTQGAVTLESFTYTLDNVGNRLSMTDADGTTTYSYDAIDRLTNVVYPAGSPISVSYSYDPMGNRLSMTEDGITTTYTYDEADQLINKTRQSDTTAYTWDNSGNLLTKGNQTFSWNAEGKLVGWSNGTDTTVYSYNGDGVRVGYTVNGAETSYLQDLAAGMAVVLSETTGSQTTNFVIGNDVIAQSDLTGIGYFLTDGLGSTRLLVDELGAVTGRYSYDAFGAERSHYGVGQTNFTFAGEQIDKDTGLQYLRARYYNPIDGRFISVDPIPSNLIEPQKLNHYIYAINNPLRYIDPKGESIIGAAIFAVTTFAIGVNVGVYGQALSDVLDNMAEMRAPTDWEFSDLATYWASGLSGGASGVLGGLFGLGGKAVGSASQPFLKDYLDDGNLNDLENDVSKGSQKGALAIVSDYFLKFSGIGEKISQGTHSNEITGKIFKKTFSTAFVSKPINWLMKLLSPDRTYPSNNYGAGGSSGGGWGDAPSSGK